MILCVNIEFEIWNKDTNNNHVNLSKLTLNVTLCLSNNYGCIIVNLTVTALDDFPFSFTKSENDGITDLRPKHALLWTTSVEKGVQDLSTPTTHFLVEFCSLKNCVFFSWTSSISGGSHENTIIVDSHFIYLLHNTRYVETKTSNLTYC